MYEPAGIAYCSGLANSTGLGARIATSGSNSVAAADLSIEVRDAAPDQFGVFYFGTNAIEVPFGDGRRCVGGAAQRLTAPMHSDGSGFQAVLLDYGSAPANTIAAGDTRHFQYWYRDPGGPGGTGHNLSDATTVVFVP